MRNAINWFEIPARDFDRAVTFYDTIFGVALHRAEFMGVPHGFFSMDEDGVSGAIIARKVVPGGTEIPGETGALLYLNADGQIDEILGRVESAGGKVIQPKADIAPQGFIAIFLDTEGNKVGLHQPSM
jgi:uncharacterized protein